MEDFHKLGKTLIDFLYFYSKEFDHLAKYIQIDLKLWLGIRPKNELYETMDFVILDSQNSNINYTKVYSDPKWLFL